MEARFFIAIFTSTVRYLLLAGISFWLCYKVFAEKLEQNKIQPKANPKNADLKREIWHSLISNFIIVVVGFLMISTPLVKYTQVYFDIDKYPVWYIPVCLLLLLIVHDTYFYFMHRLLHDKRLYKTFHLVHHKSVAPTPFASYSFHFLEGITESLATPVMLFFVPTHPLVFVSYGIIAFVINVYGHLGYELMPKRFRKSPLFQIIGTSVYHNLHHSKFNYNYSLYFRHWDRLLGTEYPKYEEEYDKIQARRFPETATVSEVVISK